MMKAFYMFVICTIFYFSVSWVTPKTNPEILKELTLPRPLSFITDEKITSLKAPPIFAGILIVFMAVLYILFR